MYVYSIVQYLSTIHDLYARLNSSTYTLNSIEHILLCYLYNYAYVRLQLFIFRAYEVYLWGQQIELTTIKSTTAPIKWLYSSPTALNLSMVVKNINSYLYIYIFNKTVWLFLIYLIERTFPSLLCFRVFRLCMSCVNGVLWYSCIYKVLYIIYRLSSIWYSNLPFWQVELGLVDDIWFDKDHVEEQCLQYGCYHNGIPRHLRDDYSSVADHYIWGICMSGL